MVEFLLERVIEMTCALTDSVRNSGSNKDMCAALGRRIQVINNTLGSLKGNPDVSPEALEELVECLEQAVALVNRIKGRWRVGRVWYAKKDSEDLASMDERIGHCISDLMLPLNLSAASMVRQSSIRSTTRTFEASLTCEEAKEFWNQFYEGKFAVEWRYFWACFAHELQALSIEPSRGLEKEVMATIDVDQNMLIDVSELNRFFGLWVDAENRKVLLDLAKESDTVCKFLDNSLGYAKDLKLEVLRVNDNHPYELKVNQVIVITYAGLIGSKRGRADRVVKFGRFDPSRSPNDVHFSPFDIEVDVNQFQIISQGSGYYLLDAFGEGGTCTKVSPESPLLLESGMIINIGGNVYIRVSDIEYLPDPSEEASEETFAGLSARVFSENSGQSVLKLEIIKGERQGSSFQFNSKFTPEVEIGRKDSSSHSKPIEFVRDALVSRSHAKLAFTESGWKLHDLNSRNGTWVSILDYDRLQLQKSSEPLRLTPGLVFAASRYWFLVLEA